MLSLNMKSSKIVPLTMLINKFFANNALQFSREKNGLLDHESVFGYLNAVETHFVIKLKENDSIKPFKDKIWGRYRSKVVET
eukprot:13500854-Ditylum_brightwellii.AAC.1